ncbi:2363_t:CDS:2 [Scutellospora calospora]|uniref:2363_t:CDS:1 n=1 Tax=Scutellospora calospora TaxID=85575 RepID=A0ACA9MIV9_9GLOM|nr:2363_t:CDS:2 [Scutellospora calospora]
MNKTTAIFFFVLFLSIANIADAGPITYILCQTACNAGWVSCYAAAGLVAGTVTGGLGAPAAAILCNVAQGACMAACAASFLTPTP